VSLEPSDSGADIEHDYLTVVDTIERMQDLRNLDPDMRRRLDELLVQVKQRRQSSSGHSAGS
jgi:hypothetical protein